MTGPIVRGLTNIITAGNATKVSVDLYGRVTALGTADLSTSDVTGVLAAARFPALTGDVTTVAGALAATIAKLSAFTTNGFVKTSGANGTIVIDTSTYITGNQTITLSGDISGSGTTAITTTLPTVNSNVGSFSIATVTVNAKGLITAVSAASTTGSGSVVLATSPTIVTPTIASYVNGNHNHQNAAGGGVLSGAATPDVVTLAPATNARNTVQPTGDNNGLVVKGNAAQSTKDIFRVENSGASAGFGVLASNVPYSLTGLLLNQVSGSISNAIYIGSTSTGAVDNTFAFSISGLGSSLGNTVGPYFGGRGNTYSALSTQRGNMFFASGYPTTPAQGEGQMRFIGGSPEAVQMFINHTGNVGMGMATSVAPGAKLHVLGSASAKTSIFQANATTPGNLTEWQDSSAGVLASMSSAGFLTLGNTSQANTTLQITKSNATGIAMIQFGAVGNTDDGAIRYDNSSVMRFFTSRFEKATLDSAGVFTSKSLSGSTSDAGTNTVLNLATVSHLSSAGVSIAAGLGTGMLFRGSSTANDREMGRVRTEWTTAAEASRASKMVFSTYAIGVETDVVTILSTGMVGINTTPSNGLHLAGTSDALSVFRVSNGGGNIYGAGVDSGGYAWSGSISNHSYYIRANNSEVARFTTSGLSVNNATTPSAQLHVKGAASAITSIFQGNATTPGSLTEWRNSSGTTLALINSSGDVKINAVGSGLYIKEGTNATMGGGTLVAGTATISTTKVTASSRIFLTDKGGGVGANIGALYVSAISAGTSFTVTSINVLDTSNFDWLIIEPS